MSRVRNVFWVSLLVAIMICWNSEALSNEQIHGYQIPTTDVVTPTIGICKSLGTTATGRNGRRRAGSTSRRSFGASYCLPYTDSGPRKLAFAAPLAVVQAVEAVEMDLITHFEHDSTDLKELATTESMDVIVSWMISTQDAGIKLTGHTDSTGTDEYNLELSRRRTEAVKELFVSRGVPANRIETEWFGETHLFKNILGRLRENRRVGIEIFQFTDKE